MSTAVFQRLACYVARSHGLSGLRAALDSKRYRVVAIVTHRRLPRSEDPTRAERSDFATYQQLAREHGVPLFSIDNRRENDAVTDQLDSLELDLVASISWRRLLTKRQLAQPKLGGVNLHRGKLPEYAGALPLHRALRDGQLTVQITAHVLTEEVDAGQVLEVVSHPVTHVAGESLDEQVERIKREITPLFGPLLIGALDRIVESRAQR